MIIYNMYVYSLSHVDMCVRRGVTVCVWKESTRFGIWKGMSLALRRPRFRWRSEVNEWFIEIGSGTSRAKTDRHTCDDQPLKS